MKSLRNELVAKIAIITVTILCVYSSSINSAEANCKQRNGYQCSGCSQCVFGLHSECAQIYKQKLNTLQQQQRLLLN